MLPRITLARLAQAFLPGLPQQQALQQVAGLEQPPSGALPLLQRMLILLAGSLTGFGLLMAIAANWDDWSRQTHFGLLGLAVLLTTLASWALSGRRALAATALGVLALASVGGLLAFFGQTYQTGADTWQLFALWAALTLPLCLGLRHPLPWTIWLVVAHLAITLWAQGQIQGGFWLQDPPILLTQLLAMGLGGLLWLALQPAWQAWTGSTRLSARVALLLMVLLSVALALSVSSMDLPLRTLQNLAPAVIVLLLLGSWYLRAARHDLLALSAIALGLLVLAMAQIVSTLMQGRFLQQHTFWVMLLIGLSALLLLGLTVAGLMRLHVRQQGSAADTAEEAIAPLRWLETLRAGPHAGWLDRALTHGIDQGRWPTRDQALAAIQPDAAEQRPAALVVLSALGGWLAVLPLAWALLTLEPSPWIGMLLGLGMVVLALLGLRSGPRSLFLEQCCYAVLLTGMIAASVFAAFASESRIDSDITTTGLAMLAALMLLTTLALRQGWLVLLMGDGLCVVLPWLIIQLTGSDSFLFVGQDAPAWALAWLNPLVALVFPALLWWLQRQGLSLPWKRFEKLENWLAGWMLVVLGQQMLEAGNTFLLTGLIGGGPGLAAGMAGSGAWSFWSWWLPLVSVLFALLGAAALWRAWPALRQPPLVALAVLLLAASALLPSLGVPLCYLAICCATGRWRLAGAAVAAVLWVIGALYYQIHYSLLEKAGLLVLTGLLLAALAIWMQQRQKHVPSNTTDDGDAPARLRLPQLRHLIPLTALATAAVVLPGIQDNEALIRDGERILVRLAPVDPRSLVQGDYMALAFALDPASPLGDTALPVPAPDRAAEDAAAAAASAAETPTQAEPESPSEGEVWTPSAAQPPARHAVFQLDGRGVATIVRLERDDSRPPLKANERRMRLREQHGQPLLVTDAWYFREGEAKAWETARYGEFRLRNDGRALLVGMADEQLQPIRPARP